MIAEKKLSYKNKLPVKSKKKLKFMVDKHNSQWYYN